MSGRIRRFGVFEADLDARELRKHGLRVKLQDKPFRVLAMLLERQGEIVTREEIQNAICPPGTFIEIEHALNGAVQKIRAALGDDASNPRFIETIPRRGYRFVAPVDQLAGVSADEGKGRNRVRVSYILAAGFVFAVSGAALSWRLGNPTQTPEKPEKTKTPEPAPAQAFGVRACRQPTAVFGVRGRNGLPTVPHFHHPGGRFLRLSAENLALVSTTVRLAGRGRQSSKLRGVRLTGCGRTHVVSGRLAAVAAPLTSPYFVQVHLLSSHNAVLPIKSR